MNFFFKITIQADSDIESDICEPTAPKTNIKHKRQRSPKKKTVRKKIKRNEIETHTSVQFTDNFNEIDQCSSPLVVLEEDDSNSRVHQVNHFPDQESISSDNEDKFGAMVSSKLQLMSPLQRLISQKIISEILLRGQLGMLKSSFIPVIVPFYMKNTSNGLTNDFLPTVSGDSNENDDSSEDEDSDPLMFQQVKRETNRDTILESVDFVKKENCR